MKNIEGFILNLLKQKQTKFSAISQYLDINTKNIRNLVESNNNINQAFAIQNSNILFPNSSQALSEKETLLIKQITPFANDSTLLLAQNKQVEIVSTVAANSLENGWFLVQNRTPKQIFFWQKQNDNIIGFEFSYINFLSELTANLNIKYKNSNVIISEGNRILMQNNNIKNITNYEKEINKNLQYPLSDWTIKYSYKEIIDNSFSIFIILTLVIIISIICLLAFFLYKELTKNLKLAKQQVSFVNQVSHELKTPLTNIRMYAEIMEDKAEFNSKEAKYLSIITSESKRLSRLIQNILNFNKEPQVNKSTFTIESVFSSIIDIFQPTLLADNMQINTTIDEACKGLEINSDKDIITQILGNFVSNAQKYAKKGKKIDIKASLNKTNNLQITVRDYGQGIDDNEMKNIFKPFYRVQSNITEGVSGTGIGLTISKQLAQKINAQIKAKNTNNGMQFSLIWNV